ncbi:endonuclease/exonuclease/phosphatase family protein [Monashia sp. NPDC004114]
MRVATFNILNGRVPSDQHVDPSGLAESVRRLDPDILALQEVDQNQSRSGFRDLTTVAAVAMGAHHHRFVAAIAGTPGATWVAATGAEQPDDAAYGIALLSRLPVRTWEVVRLEPVPVRVPLRFKGRHGIYLVHDEPRVALVATVETPEGPVTVANTHLSFMSWWNGRQLRRVVRALDRTPGPVVLVGDLNMEPARAHRITGLEPAASHPTFPQDVPAEQIDHILLGPGIMVGGSGAEALPISDHRGLWADVQIGSASDTLSIAHRHSGDPRT